MTTQQEKPQVTGRRALYANNFRSNEDKSSDITVVKEKVKLSDGRIIPNLRILKDAKRPFWVEKKGSRNYLEKKETRPLSSLDQHNCTQSELPIAMGKALGMRGQFNPNVRQIAQSPYVYGVDCDVTVKTVHESNKKYSDAYGTYNPTLSMAVLDYETNVDSDEEEINMGSLTMKDTWVCAVDKTWLRKVSGASEDRLHEVLEMYLGDMARSRGVNLRESVFLVDNEMEVVKMLFAKAHELSPDVLSIWNMKFDIDKTLQACRKYSVDPTDIFCDPRIPEEFRRVTWIPDEKNKEKAGGKSSTKDPADKWHKLLAPAGFTVIDNMCAFRMFRAMEQKMSSYSLAAVLERTFGKKLAKMKFEEASHLPENSLEWHKFMQRKYPLAYIAYNIFDCVVMELLDEEIKDISHKLMPYCGITNWMRAKSNPTRLADAYHFFLLDNHNRALCATSNKMRHELDKHIMPNTGWIITLDNTLISPEIGYNPFTPDPEHKVAANDDNYVDSLYRLNTRIYVHSADSDVSSSYPSNELALNSSRDTTLVEVCKIEGLALEEHREICINLTNPHANAAKICELALKFPNSDELLKRWHAKQAA